MENRQALHLHETVLEQLPVGVIVANHNGDMVYVNRAAEKIRNVARGMLLGRNVVECHRKTSRAKVRRVIRQLLAKPGTAYKRLMEDAENGKLIENTFASLLDDDKRSIGLMMLSEDATERHKMETEQAEAIRMLQETGANLQKRYHDLLAVSMETISSLLEQRDLYTSNHSLNVSRYALKLYEHCFGEGRDADTLRKAAVLHDIGKVAIPDQILNKPGKLNPWEYDIIKSHSVIAEEILKPLDAGGEISLVVRHHHERYDGGGYPDGLAGDDIPMLSRIIAIADAYDAMNSDRPYRKALPLERTMEEIRACSGKQFDPVWVDAFMDLAQAGGL